MFALKTRLLGDDLQYPTAINTELLGIWITCTCLWSYGYSDCIVVYMILMSWRCGNGMNVNALYCICSDPLWEARKTYWQVVIFNFKGKGFQCGTWSICHISWRIHWPRDHPWLAEFFDKSRTSSRRDERRPTRTRDLARSFERGIDPSANIRCPGCRPVIIVVYRLTQCRLCISNMTSPRLGVGFHNPFNVRWYWMPEPINWGYMHGPDIGVITVVRNGSEKQDEEVCQNCTRILSNTWSRLELFYLQRMLLHQAIGTRSVDEAQISHWAENVNWSWFKRPVSERHTGQPTRRWVMYSQSNCGTWWRSMSAFKKGQRIWLALPVCTTLRTADHMHSNRICEARACGTNSSTSPLEIIWFSLTWHPGKKLDAQSNTEKNCAATQDQEDCRGRY